MSFGKIGRKLKRVGKGAVQFRFTSTLEYIDLQLKGTWRPDKLRVIWLRSHRRVESIDIQWIPTEDRGPNGADGRATFDPPLSISLIVTLYRDASSESAFEEKEYKYYIENVGPSGKKILASFNCDMAEYAGIPSERAALDMTFKAVSKKVEKAVLGITLESEFMKQGTANDEDMQSTFSAMSAGNESLQFDEDDEDDTHIPIGGATSTNEKHLSVVQEMDEQADVEKKRIENSLKQAERRTSATGGSKPRRTIESNEAYVPPPNPFLEEQEINGQGEAEEAPPPSPTAAWLGESSTFVNCFGELVDREKLDRAKIIGLYFSASWCPPCRTFLPRLIKFYHHLKQHGKSFEILHISSDYSKQEMMKYMLDQQMPWVGLSFEGKTSDRLKKQFKVSAIPLFVIVSAKGSKLEDSAKKQVQAATSGALILKLYNQWYDKLEPEEKGDGAEERSELVDSKEKKGLLKKMKSHFTSKEKNKEMGENEMDPPNIHRAQSKEDGLNETVRQTVEEKPRAKHTKSHVTVEMLEEKEEKIRHLEEVNRTLKQTNDDLNEDVAELRRQLQEALMKLSDMESASQQLQEEKRELMANLNIRGWLFKRGIKGPTASIWRRRYFRCDQGSKIYYYKSASEGRPQGFIDLDKIISVQEVSPAQQDKNHASFTIQCDGRTYQLQAMDETTMRKWIGAINYLREYRQRNSEALTEQAASN